jgi:translation elongation factor EF-1alpha
MNPTRRARDGQNGVTEQAEGTHTMAEQLIGSVTHYFGKPQVAALTITDGELNVGDTIRIVGHTSDFTQPVKSMQVEHEDVETAKVGDQIGIKVKERARIHDQVYRVLPD